MLVIGRVLGVVGTSCSSSLRSMRIVVWGVERCWSSGVGLVSGGADMARTSGKMMCGVGGVACSAGMGVS
eukprot:5499727-Pyramimonas_sp.AAC.1